MITKPIYGQDKSTRDIRHLIYGDLQPVTFFYVSSNLIVALFIISPFAVIWMVYCVLKNGVASEKKWDDYFYEDFDYRRNGKEELDLPN